METTLVEIAKAKYGAAVNYQNLWLKLNCEEYETERYIKKVVLPNSFSRRSRITQPY